MLAGPCPERETDIKAGGEWEDAGSEPGRKAGGCPGGLVFFLFVLDGVLTRLVCFFQAAVRERGGVSQ